MKLLVIVCGWILIVFTLIPFLKKDAWWIRVFDYPKIQITLISIFCLLFGVSFIDMKSWHNLIWFIGISLSIVYHLYLIFPYTFLAVKQSMDSSSNRKDNSISILVFNIYMYSESFEKALKLIEDREPKLVFLIETNEAWSKQLSSLKDNYPYHIIHPLENTYGMMLFSKYPLEESKVHFLVEEDIPSFQTKIVLPSNKVIQFYGLHPKPPVPNENPQSTERDAELLLVGKQVRHQKIPIIVAGDMNDVAWSYTSKLFLRVSELLDPRVGRGFYNTFHARYPFLRFPLDHIFHSVHFKILELKRLEPCGSDHFPIFMELCYELGAKEEQDTPDLLQGDIALAQEKIDAV